MPEVSGSSSRVASAVKSTAGFDLQTQSGVANLLKQLRTSGLSSQTKSIVREMVLRYAQTGGDTEVRKELEAVLSSLSLLPNSDLTKEIKDEPNSILINQINEEPKTNPAKTFGFSSGRPLPVFVKSKSADNHIPKPEPVITTPIVESVPAPELEKPEEVVSEVVIESPKESVSNTTQTIEAPEKNSLDRILEIKREVITLVGNPVNLVDIDNAVGKQYMTSLLEAMKKTNGGTKVEAAEAMKNLEKAFVAVKGVVERGLKPNFETNPNQIPMTEVSMSTTSTPSTPATAKSTINYMPSSFEVKSKSEPVSVTVTPTPTPPNAPSFTEAPSVSAVLPSVKENLVQDEDVWENAATEKVLEPVKFKTSDEQMGERKLGGAPLQDIPTYGFLRTTRNTGLYQKPKSSVPTYSRENNSPPPPSRSDSGTVSVSSSEMKSTAVRYDDTNQDLMTPDVTVGLTQLLSEWKIFKGSGLFGMGPGGIDHPLYVSIKDNSMLSIMNGTFTGATPEVQQSINDYINGWRYEQSIIPQHSENFEHFLRRVVRKVLKGAKR